MFVNASWPYSYGKYIDENRFNTPNANNASVILIHGYILYKILKRAKTYGIKYKVNDNCVYYKADYQPEIAAEELRKNFNVSSIKQRNDGIFEAQLKL